MNQDEMGGQSQAPQNQEGTTEEQDARPEERSWEEMERELEEAQRERDQFRAMAQRAQADFINYKRRTEEERSTLVRNASGEVIKKLLPIVDDLERAVDALPEDAPASWGEGVRLIAQNLQALVESEGVERYAPEAGTPFDPSQHEALLYEPSDQHEPGSVISALRPGYRVSDRILRAAQVVVAREPDGQ